MVVFQTDMLRAAAALLVDVPTLASVALVDRAPNVRGNVT
jgi:hypothetical protein